MDSLVGYGSDEDNETERYSSRKNSVEYGAGSSRGREDDNYDSVNMDMSEESEESEPELPPVKVEQDKRTSKDDRRYGESRKEERGSSRDTDRRRDHDGDLREGSSRDRDRRDGASRDKDRRDGASRDRERRDGASRDRDRQHTGSDRDRRADYSSLKRGVTGDRPEDRTGDKSSSSSESRSHADGGPAYSRDAHDAVSHRFVDRRDRDRERDRERDRDRDSRDRHASRSHDRSERGIRGDRHRRSRSRERPRAPGSPPHQPPSSSGNRGSPPAPVPSGEYRPSSYKVNKKLQVMEKMGLQIKTPDGCMKTAQQLRADSGECMSRPAPAPARPNYYNPAGGAASVLEQVKKRKLLWANKNKNEAEEAAKWTGTRFAADNDGKQTSKFMRLMGIKDPAAVSKPDEAKECDPIKKQEELFQAMQAQYEVARATTHTMRGVGLGFQRQY